MNPSFPIVVEHKDLILKLYNWMDYSKEQSARNVIAYNKDGDEIWTIDALGGLPESDCYTSIKSENGRIYAFNFQGYLCTVDEATGKIITSQFTK